jgi:hypothetical protein
LKKKKFERENMEIQGKKNFSSRRGKIRRRFRQNFWRERGATVALHDKKPVAELDGRSAFFEKEKFRRRFDRRQIPSWLLDQIDLVVISPGRSDEHDSGALC